MARSIFAAISVQVSALKQPIIRQALLNGIFGPENATASQF
jgi:hypothetical protein